MRVQGKTKHLMTGPTGNIEFCFPFDASLLRVPGKKISMFPLGPAIYVLNAALE